MDDVNRSSSRAGRWAPADEAVLHPGDARLTALVDDRDDSRRSGGDGVRRVTGDGVLVGDDDRRVDRDGGPTPPRGELLVPQAVLEPAEPPSLVEHEPDRADADEVVGEELAERGGVPGALGAGPALSNWSMSVVIESSSGSSRPGLLRCAFAASRCNRTRAWSTRRR